MKRREQQHARTDKWLAALLHTSPSHGALAAPQAVPPSPPPLPLRRAPHGASHEAPTPAMATLPWRASHKLIFLCGMTKTDAYELPLAIPTLNFIRNEL
jgi:hypothetical protein